MTDTVSPVGQDLVASLIAKYRSDLTEVAGTTTAAIKQVQQQLTGLERNQIAIAAQKALLDTLEKDLKANSNVTPSTNS